MSAARERSLPSLEYRLAKSVRPWQYFKAAELLNSIGITLDTLASSDGEEQVVKRQARKQKRLQFFFVFGSVKFPVFRAIGSSFSGCALPRTR